MSYIALARKWRPRTFTQLVGQEHLTKALLNSLNANRLHHAYLFTGTRGVGKTSVARLLAKALNCEQGVSATPCLQCSACLAIEQGQFIDLIEIDGASKTRVEDTRELLENVQYVPTSGRFKIYLIDEVHMLSQHSFNALLKTLEEPPSHVKFLLATTDPQKLPATILSRCLQFNLKHLPPDRIVPHLGMILNEEKIPFESRAIELIAKAAQGSMRDALSLLDQVIAANPEQLQEHEVKQLLGYSQHDYALGLLQALANLDATTLITLSHQIALEGGHFVYVLEELLSHLHQISLYQALPRNALFLTTTEDLITLSTQFAAEDVQLFYQIALKGLQEIHLAPTLNIGFEMVLLRMYTFRPVSEQKIPPLAYEQQETLLTHDISTASHTIELAPPESDWAKIVSQLQLNGLALSAAEHAELLSKTSTAVTLRVDKRHQSLFTAAVIKRIEQGLTNYYKEVLKLTIKGDDSVSSSPAKQRQEQQQQKQEEATNALQADPFFKQLQEEFSAELVKNSIVALKSTDS